MFAIVRLAFKDLRKRWKLAFSMAVLFSISFASYLSLITYQKSLATTYFSLNNNWLVVQQGYGSGEIHGSRLSPAVGELMRANGYDHPIPEIHQVVGTSIANGIMMRGVNPEDLDDVSPYKLLFGRGLTSSDPPRVAMLGESLAERLQVKVGGTIKLRGRNFSVIGIFKTGSYEDNQAWISLVDAQTLLNYGDDVSVYYIPDNGPLLEGTSLLRGISIGRRGDSGNTFGQETMSFFRYLGLIGGFSGVATLITLSNLLWRLAFLHRREFGILRTLGFDKSSTLFYLVTQAALIVGVGTIIGAVLAITVVMAQINGFSAFGIGLSPTWDLSTVGLIILVTLLIVGAGILLPAWRVNRMTTPELLGKE